MFLKGQNYIFLSDLLVNVHPLVLYMQCGFVHLPMPVNLVVFPNFFIEEKTTD
jgi:hypothetical protein